MTRTLIYDATQVMGDPLRAGTADRVIANRLAADPFHRAWMIQVGTRAVSPAPAAQLYVKLADARAVLAGRRRAAFEAARTWLLDPEVRPAPRRREPDSRPRNLAILSRARAPNAPQGAVFVKVGLKGWESPVLDRWLARRPDLVAVAILANPWQLDFPEYASEAEAEAAELAWRNVTRRAHAIISPDPAFAAQTPNARMQIQPSELAGSATSRIDPALANAPFLVLPEPIEARSNTLLILQIWRDLAHAGEAPKLVLAGDRGAQTDQIAPMLDWADSVRANVFEAGRLSADGLRKLLVHARALLAPAFAAPDGALVRDARALGTHVLASKIPVYGRADDAHLTAIEPLDGPAWREAILHAAKTPPRAAQDSAALPNWTEWSSELFAYLDAL